MPDYRAIYEELNAEATRLLEEQKRLSARVDQLMQAMAAIRALATESDAPVLTPPPMPPDVEAGFTEKVRAVLRVNPFRALTAVQVRDVLLEKSPNEDPKVMLIHAHNTLKRLSRQGEVEESDGADGRKAYHLKNVNLLGILSGLVKPSGFGELNGLIATVNPDQTKKK